MRGEEVAEEEVRPMRYCAIIANASLEVRSQCCFGNDWDAESGLGRAKQGKSYSSQHSSILKQETKERI